MVRNLTNIGYKIRRQLLNFSVCILETNISRIIRQRLKKHWCNILLIVSFLTKFIIILCRYICSIIGIKNASLFLTIITVRNDTKPVQPVRGYIRVLILPQSLALALLKSVYIQSQSILSKGCATSWGLTIDTRNRSPVRAREYQPQHSSDLKYQKLTDMHKLCIRLIYMIVGQMTW